MLTQNGIDYICQNFGDESFCCVASGLSWYYTYQNINYPETGATAQIVSRFTLGIIESLTMTNPARGTFTQAMLNAANGSPVTLQDAKEITYHDEPHEDQWCYEDSPPPQECEDFTNQSDCIAVGCHWWNNSCHSEPEPPPGWITCYRCKPVGNGYNIPESKEFEGDVCPEGWYGTQPPCNVPPCSFYTNQSDCIADGCYWWSDNTCHDYPEEEPPTPDYLPYIVAGVGAGVAITLAIVLIKRRK